MGTWENLLKVTQLGNKSGIILVLFCVVPVGELYLPSPFSKTLILSFSEGLVKAEESPCLMLGMSSSFPFCFVFLVVSFLPLVPLQLLWLRM